MLSISELNKTWMQALKSYASTPLQGERGTYLPIGQRSLNVLEALWKENFSLVPDIGQLISAGKDVRFYGDPHFQHANIIKLCHRPFRDVEEMDSVLLENFKKAYEAADFIVFLGDYSIRDPLKEHRKFKNLYPKKHITLIGNHDAKPVKAGVWVKEGAIASIAFSLELKIIKQWIQTDNATEASLVDWDVLPNRINFGVSHWPVPPSHLPGLSWLNIHGHTHNRPSKPLSMNFSVEAINYHPASLRQLLTVEKLDNLVQRQKNPDIFSHCDTKVEPYL